MHKNKIFIIFVFLLLIFAGIIALTQEKDNKDFDLKNVLTEQKESESEDFSSDDELTVDATLAEDVLEEDWIDGEIPEWVKSTRWFRSNSGGMVLDEASSRTFALRNKYALIIDFISRRDLPEYLLQYYDKPYIIEVRSFFENAEEARTQWIFREYDGTTRLIAVFVKTENEKNEADEYVTNEEDPEDTEVITATIKRKVKNGEPNSGFIEIYDENSHLLTELRFFDDGNKTKTNYIYNNGYIIRAVSLEWEEETGKFTESYTDFFRYNRSAYLRSVERVFSKDQQITLSDNTIRTAFPNNLRNAVVNLSVDTKLNAYPEFFGDISVGKNNKIVFTTDDRGRVLTQTLFDTGGEEEKIIWVIQNTWSGERISSISKTEGDTVLLAQYEYNSNGDRVWERNLKNGNLERLVRSESSRDIEELYIDNVVVLRAVWEEGRKISETRVSPGIKGN